MKIETDPFEYRLCYVCPRNGLAWFTSIPLSDQWGDDWDDAPYEHNAGDPYDNHYETVSGKRERVTHDLVRVAWSSGHETPRENFVNSPFSVKSINSKNVAWLMVPGWRESSMRPISAGTSLRQFIEDMTASGGEVFLPIPLAVRYVQQTASGATQKISRIATEVTYSC